MTDKKDIEFESDKVKTYVQQIQAENGILRQECERLKHDNGYEVGALEKTIDNLKAELTRANCQIADDEILQCDMREAIEALKAENEELKRQHQADKGLITATGKQNYQLIQEYDRLKTENDELKKQLTAYIKEAEENFEVHTTLKDNYRKLYQTLTEIKEIGKKSMREGKMLSGGWLYQFIEQKISEVEDGI